MTDIPAVPPRTPEQLAREMALFDSIGDLEALFEAACSAAFYVIFDAVPSEIEGVADNLWERFVAEQTVSLGGTLCARVNEALARNGMPFRLAKVPAASDADGGTDAL